MDERNNLDHGARQSIPLCPVSLRALSVQHPSGAISRRTAPRLHPQPRDASPMLSPSNSARALCGSSLRVDQCRPFRASIFGPLLLPFYKLTDTDECIAGPRLCFGGACVEY